MVRFESSNLGTYEGTLSNDGSEIVGELKQPSVTHAITFKRVDKVPTLGRPQDPQKPYPYLEEEVSYENKADVVKLAGTLTLPRTKDHSPSRPLSRVPEHKTAMRTTAGHRPFWY